MLLRCSVNAAQWFRPWSMAPAMPLSLGTRTRSSSSQIRISFHSGFDGSEFARRQQLCLERSRHIFVNCEILYLYCAQYNFSIKMRRPQNSRAKGLHAPSRVLSNLQGPHVLLWNTRHDGQTTLGHGITHASCKPLKAQWSAVAHGVESGNQQLTLDHTTTSRLAAGAGSACLVLVPVPSARPLAQVMA